MPRKKAPKPPRTPHDGRLALLRAIFGPPVIPTRWCDACADSFPEADVQMDGAFGFCRRCTERGATVEKLPPWVRATGLERAEKNRRYAELEARLLKQPYPPGTPTRLCTDCQRFTPVVELRDWGVHGLVCLRCDNGPMPGEAPEKGRISDEDRTMYLKYYAAARRRDRAWEEAAVYAWEAAQ